MIDFVPRLNHVLIEVNEAEINKTSEGLSSLSHRNTRPNIGTILMVGSDVAKDLVVGKKCIFKEYSGITLPDSSDKLIILLENDIIGIEKKE